jgi:hypothetical protein
MPARIKPIQYRSNGNILGKPPMGRKVMCSVTGFWTYEQYLTVNDYGDLVDPRFEGYDINQGVPTLEYEAVQTPDGST